MINRISRADCDKLAADTFRLIWNFDCQHNMVEIDGERVGYIEENLDNVDDWKLVMFACDYHKFECLTFRFDSIELAKQKAIEIGGRREFLARVQDSRR